MFRVGNFNTVRQLNISSSHRPNAFFIKSQHNFVAFMQLNCKTFHIQKYV
eukprot:NODE_4113_length_841_cov_2.015152_g3404_i0.p4 GENE.NODE_4113_length_841_cov_2.015152_g3404_i0~~NODE_4113_length_841_cov_2.015152_g3404_i0.p4  ORF type:complete len:50 (+),score=6.47 NODE_4113_length_841_cov_2.015152_g3404_i0:203-352(+)